MKKMIDLLTVAMHIGFNAEIFTLHTSAQIEILSHNIN
jgi:hypothetical protein